MRDADPSTIPPHAADAAAPPAVVALDYGGTLTGKAADVTGHLVARVLAERFAAVVPATFAVWFDVTYRGDLPGTLQRTAADAGIRLPAEVGAVVAAIEQETTECPVDPRAAAAVRELHLSGYRLVLAANTPRRLAERHATLAEAGIADCFTSVVLSSELHVAKPQPGFYRHVLAAAGCCPEHVLFVGDRLANDVHGPLAHGMRAVLIDRHGTGHEAPAGVPVLTHVADLPALLDKEACS